MSEPLSCALTHSPYVRATSATVVTAVVTTKRPTMIDPPLGSHGNCEVHHFRRTLAVIQTYLTKFCSYTNDHCVSRLRPCTLVTHHPSFPQKTLGKSPVDGVSRDRNLVAHHPE